MVIFIKILFLWLLSTFCYSSDYKQKSIITSYPLSKSLYDDKSIIPIDRVKMNRVVEKISTLRFGDTSYIAVKKIGYHPDTYFIAPNKSLKYSSDHLIMSYIFSRQPNKMNKLVVADAYLFKR